MKTKWFVGSLLAISLAAPAMAQEVVGSSIVGGRTVRLMSDFTWKYDAPASGNCPVVQDNVSFCGESAGWTRTSGNGNGDAAAVFRLNDRNYGEFIVEKLGSEDGMNPELMRSTLIENAADAAGIPSKDVPILGSEPAQVDGFSGETITYIVKIKGLSFIFINTVVLGKHQAVQIVTYSVGLTLTDEMKANHKRFLEATRLK
jgi:hypothetical protein